MDTSLLLPTALVALFVAILVTAYEMRLSLAPASCDECPHCRDLAAERAQRELDLQTWYARSHGLDGDEDDDRRID
jgi:hypothetical protein